MKNFEGGLFEKIHFQNFQKNRRYFLNFQNFDIFLASFDGANDYSSHERKTNRNRICIFGKKLHRFGKYFGSFYETVRSPFLQLQLQQPFLKKKNSAKW